MKIAFITDVHANLPALEAVLAALEQEGYDLLVHGGDVIGIGPFPTECLDRLLNMPRTHMIMGNHDAWFAFGLPSPPPPFMTEGERHHHDWTHAQLEPTLRPIVSEWPYVLTETANSATVTFLHYPLKSEREFVSVMRQPTPMDLDTAFTDYPGDLIFYGHHHPVSDLQGRKRYINPGSLGCTPTAEANYCLLETTSDGWAVRHEHVPYDDAPLYRAFEERDVPERALLYRAFFGGRFEV